MKITGSGEIEEVVKGKVYRVRHHLGRDPKTGRYIRSPKKTVYGTKSGIHKLNGTLSLVMDAAATNELIEANPCEHVKAPGLNPKSARPSPTSKR